MQTTPGPSLEFINLASTNEHGMPTRHRVRIKTGGADSPVEMIISAFAINNR